MGACEIIKVTSEELANMMGESEIDGTVDIGVAFVNVCKHPKHGRFIGVSGCEGRSAVVHLVR